MKRLIVDIQPVAHLSPMWKLYFIREKQIKSDLQVAVYKWKKSFKEKKSERFMEIGFQRKKSQRVGLYMIFTVCHLTPVNVVASLWGACNKVFQRGLFPVCPLSVVDSMGCPLLVHVEQR